MMMALAIAGWGLFSAAVVLFELDRLYLQGRAQKLEDCIEIWRGENTRLRRALHGKGMDLHQAALNLKEIRRLTTRKRDPKGRFIG